MKDLSFFQKFLPKKELEDLSTKDVWSYTRVSSKEQFVNKSSVNNQISTNKLYANDFNYALPFEFGGTYESAKSDFTRKEFKRLIDKVESAKKKPYAILVFKMSRFSRSGGNAIGLVNHLVEVLGVHLIETSTGLNTTTERGKAAIYESLFHAYKENLERKEIIIPNMKTFLKKGFRFGAAPFGYDHYGPRVRRVGFLNNIQKIVINTQGKIFREAWEWKASGNYSDSQILSKLSARGIELSKQQINKSWKNPFYCGINISKMLEEPVKGEWEPLITVEIFIKVQEVLSNNYSGYQHNNENNKRPLNRIIKCDGCGGFMVGYEVIKKELHYYRCPNCTGVSVNANSTPKSRKKGANVLFEEFLDSYTLDRSLLPLIKLQIEKLFCHYNDDNIEDTAVLENQIIELNKNIKQLKIRFGLGEVDKDTYHLTFEHLNQKIRQINKELNTVRPVLSNLENMVSDSLEKAANINKIWGSSNLDDKRGLCNLLFPGGIYYDVKNHQYLTREVNQYLSLINSFSNDYVAIKKETCQQNIEKSPSVARWRFELQTSGL